VLEAKRWRQTNERNGFFLGNHPATFYINRGGACACG
jgi:hypothetical protein